MSEFVLPHFHLHLLLLADGRSQDFVIERLYLLFHHLRALGVLRVVLLSVFEDLRIELRKPSLLFHTAASESRHHTMPYAMN